MIEIKDEIPSNNKLTYEIIYKIEVGLREFLIYKLQPISPKWWKERLPGDILDSYRKGLIEEKSIKWTKLIPHHPLYYIDFPDLRKIIEKNDNWKDAFQDNFKDKEMLSTKLRSIEPIRNKIAHNRKISDLEYDIAETTYEQLVTAIGSQLFSELLNNQTIAPSIRDSIQKMSEETKTIYEACKLIKEIEKIPYWKEVFNKWWFDSDYLLTSIEGISNFYRLLEKYTTFTHFRGSGYQIERWLLESDFDKAYEIAKAEFAFILSNERE